MPAHADNLSTLSITGFLVVDERLIPTEGIVVAIIVCSDTTHLILRLLPTACIITLDDARLVIWIGATAAALHPAGSLIHLQVVDGRQNLRITLDDVLVGENPLISYYHLQSIVTR